MKVFISWSGDTSKSLAEVLRQWLPSVLQAVKPYYSADDIAKGARWNTEIAVELQSARVGLICLTADNLSAPWVMFEAGALSKSLETSRVCPLLFGGVEPTDISGPLVQFQAAQFGKTEMKRVTRMMNAELGDAALGSEVLEGVFEMWWPQLDSRVRAILDGAPAARAEKGGNRDPKDLLEELLVLTRGLAVSGATVRQTSVLGPRVLRDLADGWRRLTEGLILRGSDPVLLGAARKLWIPLQYVLLRAPPDRYREAVAGAESLGIHSREVSTSPAAATTSEPGLDEN